MDELSHYSPEPLFHEKEAIAREEEESSPLVVIIPVSFFLGEAGNGTSNQVSQVGFLPSRVREGAILSPWELDLHFAARGLV